MGFLGVRGKAGLNKRNGATEGEKMTVAVLAVLRFSVAAI
jgi:hypothetical protein